MQALVDGEEEEEDEEEGDVSEDGEAEVEESDEDEEEEEEGAVSGEEAWKQTPDGGCLCYALRTGFSSSQVCCCCTAYLVSTTAREHSLRFCVTYHWKLSIDRCLVKVAGWNDTALAVRISKQPLQSMVRQVTYRQ